MIYSGNIIESHQVQILNVYTLQLVTWTAVVFYHPWYSPEYEILSLEKAAQSQYSHRSHKLGAAVPIEDVHDSYVMAAANVAITELNRRSNSLFKTVLVEILHGTVQASVVCITILIIFL